MKLSYFGYSVEDINNAQQYIFDLRPFMSAYNKTDILFKSGFNHGEDHLFLLPCKKNLYHFIITRQNEIIKKIQSSDLIVSEIADMLEDGEKIGFTSYVYFGKFFIGFASTLKAPKAKIFNNFMNDIFSKINIRNYNFILHPLMNQALEEEVMQMPFIGRSTMIIKKDNNFFQDIAKTFNFSVNDSVYIDSFLITIKPKPRKNIEKAVKKVIQYTDDDGLDQFILRAKEDLDENLTDFYLVGKGQVSDILKGRNENEILNEIYRRSQNNTLLQEKIIEFKENEPFKEKVPQIFIDHHDAAAWPGGLGSI